MRCPNTKQHFKNVGEHFKIGFTHIGKGFIEALKTPKHLCADIRLHAEVEVLGYEAHDAKVILEMEAMSQQ